MIEVKQAVPETDANDIEYVDIFKKIERGLRTDYVDPYTTNVWMVEDYINGKTKGVRVRTKYGRKLGTAYPAATLYYDEADGETSMYLAIPRTNLNLDLLDLDGIKNRLALCIKETIHGSREYETEKDAIINYIYSDKFRSKYGMTPKEVDEFVLDIWNRLKRPSEFISYDELTDNIVEKTVKDFNSNAYAFMKLYNEYACVRQFVKVYGSICDDKRSMHELMSRLSRIDKDDPEYGFVQFAINKARERIEIGNKSLTRLRKNNTRVIDKMRKAQSELRLIYSFFLGGRAKELVDGKQKNIEAALLKIESDSGLSEFCKINKINRKDWF